VKLVPTPLAGAYVIELEQREDGRGFFAELFSEREFREHGLETGFVQINDSLSRDVHTLRGMHYQHEPEAEVKVVRAMSGALWDVILDLRPESETFGMYFGAELSAENRLMMYVPRGFAHGFITLAPETEVLYLVSALYAPELATGVRWDDPRFAIEWPAVPAAISKKDRSYPDFES
jgi:dTDP-4-dehydrorhamnose 3,5-epimerase